MNRTQSWPAPERLPSLGAWISAVHRQRPCLADEAHVSPGTVKSWESDRHRPRLSRLRQLRDGLDMPNEVLVRVLARFYRRREICNDTDAKLDIFWHLIKSPIGSEEERIYVNEVVCQYRHLAVTAIGRHRWRCDQEDLHQMGLIGVSRAALGYIPFLGSFARYGWVCARGSIVTYMSAEFYRGCTNKFRNRVRLVNRHIRDFVAAVGRWPSETEVVEKLGMPQAQVSEVLEFLSTRTVSLEGGEDGPDLHGRIGARDGGYELADANSWIRQELRDIPTGAQIIIETVLEGNSISAVSATLGISQGEARPSTPPRSNAWAQVTCSPNAHDMTAPCPWLASAPVTSPGAQRISVPSVAR